MADEEEDLPGSIVACFAAPTDAASAGERIGADTTWHETITFIAQNLPYRSDARRTPEALLASLEQESGFVCGWWQSREGGPSLTLEGDPVEHAIECVSTRDATGLANFLEWLDVRRWHAEVGYADAAWQPTRAHRLTSAKGTPWEWWQFFRMAHRTLRGKPASSGYLRAERRRLTYHWTREAWPATAGEAIERIGLRRVSPTRWALPGQTPTEQ